VGDINQITDQIITYLLVTVSQRKAKWIGGSMVASVLFLIDWSGRPFWEVTFEQNFAEGKQEI
jgi:hypothetical protein